MDSRRDELETGQPTRVPIPDPTILTTEALRRDIGSLRELLETRINEMDRRFGERFEAADRAVEVGLRVAKEAVDKAEAAQDKRMEAMNEFRAQLADQTATFVPRSELDQHFDQIEKSIDELKQSSQTTAGRREGLSAGWGILIGAVGLIGSLIAIFYAISAANPH